MFLASIARRVRRDDDGVAMAAVVGLMAMGVVLTAVISTTVVSSVSFTSLTRAGVQSQAGADAGVAAARAGLIAGECFANLGVFESANGTVPSYRAEVQVRTGSTWTNVCPSTTEDQVRIVSTGWSSDDGIGPDTGGDETVVEAMLSTVEAGGGLAPSGPALYAYNSQGFSGGGTILSLSGEVAEIMVYEGGINCNGGADGTANLVIRDGNLTLSGGCLLKGNVWVDGTANLSGGGQINGNLVADGVTMTTRVGGSVWSDGPLSVSNGTGIGGNAVAHSLAISSSTIGGSAWIRNNAYFGWSGRVVGNLTAQSRSNAGATAGTVGSQTLIPAGPGAAPWSEPPAPFVPGWTDYPYNADDWPGHRLVVMGSNCNSAAITAALATIGDRPGIIDSRGCSSNGLFSVSGGDTYNVRDDLVIVANRFNFSGGAHFNAPSAARMWLIIPDGTDDDEPTCAANSNFSISGGATWDSDLTLMIYTPCRVDFSSSTYIRGQVYAGAATIAGGATIAYAAVGLPGFDLSTGDTTGSTTTEADRTVLWQRGLSSDD